MSGEMSGETSGRRLSVVEVTRFRPHAADYHAYVEVLNSRMVEEARSSGWLVERIAAADVGTAALLEATAASDAIVIMGGEDVTPRFYGAADGYPAEGQHFETADEGQIALVRRALRRGTPLLGVCRGHQVVNVALGGTLVQDLGTDTIHKNLHVPIVDVMHAHEVALAPGSRLAEQLGATTIRVQSAHHQAVASVGTGLVAVATAPDGLIEAVEHESAPIVGVQWHPEDPGAPEGQLAALLELVAAREPSLASL
jgi:putative glutamine amidotransferase